MWPGFHQSDTKAVYCESELSEKQAGKGRLSGAVAAGYIIYKYM